MTANDSTDDGRPTIPELARLLRITEDEAAQVRVDADRDDALKAELIELAAQVGFEHGWIEASGDWVSVPKASLLALLRRVRDMEAAADSSEHSADPVG
ncbi:hypothetical protein ACQPYH_04210 [Kribbella sp. CA-245084]|uniref:hypothetical protein n=1 Tax=Kribbella sp. CA-245084 TaxID=3239940 RepID=UPI003D8F9CCF